MLLCISSYSQTEIKVPAYQPTLEYGKKIFLHMEYGKFNLKDKPELKSLDASRILKVEVICTDFPRGVNLKKLNSNRLMQLKEVLPQLQKNEDVVYKTIRQMDFEGKLEAQKMFHGLVITYVPKPTKASMKKEMGLMDKLLKGEPIKATDYSVTEEEEKDSVTSVSESSIRSLAKHEWDDSTLHHLTEYSVDYLKRVGSLYYQKDSTVFKIMERNKNWKSLMISADLTGSMYPYTAQILAWLQLQTKGETVKQFVFFNDGNRTPDRKKIIGKTGGIYNEFHCEYKAVKKLAEKTMSAGGGGDAPENNIEALIKGLKNDPDCDHIVMVADNNANIKDYKLIKQINKPVKIVLCGVYGYLNLDYLNLAKYTGGSVHTIEEDITNLASLNEGEYIELAGKKYKVSKGRIVRI